MSGRFDPQRLRLDPSILAGANVAPATSKPRQRYKRFLKGPVPLRWLERAGQCSERGSSPLAVGVVLWYLAGLKRTHTVKLAHKPLLGIGLTRFAAYRALEELERADLVSVVRHKGKAPVVTILEVPDPGEAPP